MTIVTSDKNILKRYRPTKRNPEDYPRVKLCPHCGRGKLYLRGRMYTPCPFCSDIAKYPKKIRIKK
jgi:uncharacterized protein (DUF983 family)